MTARLERVRARLGTRRLLALAVFALSVLVYANSWDNGFALDDRGVIRDNPTIRGVAKIPQLFTQDYWYPELISGLYRPVVTSTYAINYELAGLDPRSYHLVNILLHGLVSVLVFVAARRVFGSLWIAAGSGLFFAAHAVHSEVVANVVGRAEILSALFFFVTFLAWLRARETSGRRSALLYAGSLAALMVGMLCKETAVTVLGAIGMYDVVYGRPAHETLLQRVGGAVAAHWPRYAGYVAVVAVYMVLRVLALGWEDTLPPQIHLDNPLIVLDAPWRILSALKVGLVYLWVQAFPLRLSYDYSYNVIPTVTSLADPWAWVALGGWAAIAALVVWTWRRGHRHLFFAVGLYLITFSVISNVFVVIGTIMGERLVYLSSAAFCFAVVIVLWQGLGRMLGPHRRRQAFVGVLGVVVALHAVRAVLRNPVWTDSKTLFLTDWRTVPQSSKAMNNAAAMYFGEKDYEKALTFFHRAIEIEPHYWHPYRTAGFTYTALGKDMKAMEMYDLALRYGARDPKLLNNLGFILVDRELEVNRGVALLKQAVEMRPKNYEFLDSLGWGYYKQGELEKARETLRRSLELNDTSPSTSSRREHLRVVEEAILEQRALARSRESGETSD